MYMTSFALNSEVMYSARNGRVCATSTV